jgi:hypothetical protein
MRLRLHQNDAAHWGFRLRNWLTLSSR